MKKNKQILAILFLAALVISMLCIPALAVTESEVEAQVAASGKGAVTGNVLIWFLCAVAFLKVSQKIDSFMATLGVNVGRTGSSMLGEAMIAMRAVTMIAGGRQGTSAGRAGTAASSSAGKSGNIGTAGFFQGGLAGMVSRKVTSSAVKTATTQTSAAHAAQSHMRQAAATAAAQTASDPHITSETHMGSSSIYAEKGTPTGMPLQDGVIATGSEVSAQAASIENVPSASSVPNDIPPQDGVIVTGGGMPALASPIENAPSTSFADMQPQDGVILTGNEAPSSIPMGDSEQQTVSMPSEGTSSGITPPQDGIIITEGSASVHTPQLRNMTQGNPIGASPQGNTSRSGGSRHTESRSDQTSQTRSTATSSAQVQTNRFHSSGAVRPSLGGMVFSRSLAAGGSFANDVIGTVARGEVAGSITGDMAAQSLQSYLGYTSEGKVPPIFSNAEIGHGRITGSVSTPEHPQPMAFGMYHAEQYTEPTGAFSKVRSMDGTLWYAQLAQDAVERKPYKAPDDRVAYREHIVKKLPDPPKRKDRI